MNTVFFKHKSIYAILLLTLIIVIPLTGCQKVKPITSAEFQTIAKNMGYTTQDTTSDYARYEIVQKSLSIEHNGLRFDFLEIDSKDNAIKYFNTNKNYLKNKKSGIISESSENLNSYCMYKLTTNENYYFVKQVEKTLIYADCPPADSQKVDDLVKAIKY